VALRKGFGSKSESYRRKNEIDAAYSIQADSGIPIDAFVQHLNRKDKKDACIDKLKISGRLGVKDSLDFQTTLNLTNAQMQGIRQAGLDISPQKEITELKRVKELEHKLEKKELLINKKRDREQVTMKQVIFRSIFFPFDTKNKDFLCEIGKYVCHEGGLHHRSGRSSDSAHWVYR